MTSQSGQSRPASWQLLVQCSFRGWKSHTQSQSYVFSSVNNAIVKRASTENATLSRAIFRYAGAPQQDPTTPMTSGPADGDLIEADLRPLVPTKVSDPDVSLTFDLVIVCSSPSHRFSPLDSNSLMFLDQWPGSMEHQRSLLPFTWRSNSRESHWRCYWSRGLQRYWKHLHPSRWKDRPN